MPPGPWQLSPKEMIILLLKDPMSLPFELGGQTVPLKVPQESFNHISGFPSQYSEWRNIRNFGVWGNAETLALARLDSFGRIAKSGQGGWDACFEGAEAEEKWVG